MPLAAGTRLGPYVIETLVGAGGMGEVYQARDTRLDRVVAVKILPALLAAHPDLRDRFEREARAISQLSHPNICTLFDYGHDHGTEYLVMEFLDGETLADRLQRGPMPFDQALSIAVDIAGALDSAHRRGVVHRDLKPGNVMLVRRPGLSGAPLAKLLDFGLAKLAVEPATAASAVTVQPPLTERGSILGTFQYMAPEQIEGGEADERTDIFAFGALLYEVLTGRRAFEAKSQASLIGAILKDHPPPISTVQTLSPPEVDRIVARCLAKDPDERWQSASDLAAELRWIQQGAPREAPRLRQRRVSWREAAAWLLAASAIAAAAFYRFVDTRPEPEQTLVQFTIEETTDAPFSVAPIAPFPAVSPDGKKVVFVATRPTGTVLVVRALDSPGRQLLAGTDAASLPFWSADSRSIGFIAPGGKLRRYDTTTGTVQTICDAPGFEGGTWNRDGTILFGTPTGPLYRVSVNGGTPQPVTTIDKTKGDVSDRWPVFMPDGRHYAFVTTPRNTIRFGALDSTSAHDVLATESKPVFSSGYLLYGAQGVLQARRFDPVRGELLGDAVAIAENVRMAALNARATYSVSDDGVLVYRAGTGTSASHLVWYDRQGKLQSEELNLSDLRSVDLSPDDSRIVFHRHDVASNGGGVWLKDLARGTVSRVTPPPDHSYGEVWHPDGRHIIFLQGSGVSSVASGGGTTRADIYMIAANGTGSAEPLLVSPSFEGWPAISPNGETLIFQESPGPGTNSDIYVMSMKDRKPVAYAQGPGNEIHPAFSPDGKWVAYASNESGQYEVYVQPYPANGEKWQISTRGGVQPRWRSDGAELFFLSTTREMMSASVTSQRGRLEPGVPKLLFQTQVLLLTGTSTPFRLYAVKRKGEAFLVDEEPRDPARQTDPLTVVLNWTRLLRR